MNFQNEYFLVLSWETLELRAICEIEEEANQKLGLPAADALRRRLADLDAAENVYDIAVGNPSAFTTDDGEFLFKINLADGFSMVFCCSQVRPPMLNGSLNWAQVRRIKIISISKQTS